MMDDTEKSGKTIATPPPKRGFLPAPCSGAMRHAPTPAPGGRYRRYLSLREGLEQPPGGALKDGGRTYEMAVAPMAHSTFNPRDELEDNHIMSSHVHIGLYDALREAGASEEKALAALATLPFPQHLATKEDLLKAIGEVKTDLAVLKFAVFTFGAAILALLVKLVFYP